METFKNLIHKGGEKSESKGKIKGSCALITLHKSTFDRSKARRVNPEKRSCFTILSTRLSSVSQHILVLIPAFVISSRQFSEFKR
jgi:hypothetical protein